MQETLSALAIRRDKQGQVIKVIKTSNLPLNYLSYIEELKDSLI